MRAQDVLDAIEREEKHLRSLSRKDKIEARAYPACSIGRRRLEATAGAFNHAAHRLRMLRTTGRLAELLAEPAALEVRVLPDEAFSPGVQEAVHYEVRSISTRAPDPNHPDIARKGYW